MTKNRQLPDRRRRSRPEPSSDEGTLGVSVPEEATFDEIFSSLAEFTSETDRSDLGTLPPIASGRTRWELSPKQLSDMQKILLLGTVAVAAALVYTLAGKMKATSLAGPTGSPRPSVEASPQTERVTAETPVQPAWAPPAQPPEPGNLSLPHPEPTSLQLADKLYLRRDFEPAAAMYDKLYRRLPASDENLPIRDFLLLRMALCYRNSGNIPQADGILRTISLSRLPILRALARYHQSTTLISRNRYLEAAAKAYQTIALIELVDCDRKWTAAVQQQCWFLVAEVMTRNLLALSDADVDLPPELWNQHPDIDPFVNLDEPQLRIFLTAGTETLNEALLSPQIRSIHDNAAARHWSVICNGASIEELLARFAANAGLNIRWADDEARALAEDSVRRRPVYLCLASATPQQVITTAAGSVGLLAQLEQGGNVRVLDPAFYTSLADHTKLLANESIALWQRFLLTCENDQRVPNGHFALGLLQAARGQLDEAIAEYKLVANRFPKHALAPYALFHSGKLKVRLRDYVGAHEDLKQLVEFYPEAELSDQACLFLADATMKAGLYEEATGLYRKVYNLGLSVESQTESALGAGRCFYETRNHEKAAQWLNRYITLAKNQSRPEFYAACLLLGKTYLALHQPLQAHTALNLAIKGELSRQQHVETIAVLARAYIDQGLFLEALHTLDETGGWQLSQQETIELLLLRAEVLRTIGLADKAVVLLNEKRQFLSNPELKGKVALELAKCHADTDDLERSKETLSDALAVAGPGPLAQQIGCELARVCLRLNQPAQAASICSQLLAHADETDRGPILDVLADVRREQGQYDQAVAALLDRRDSAADPNDIHPSRSPGIGK